MYLIDTHTHIYLPEFDKDRDQLIKNATAKGINYFLMPAIDSETHEKMLLVERNFTNCISMIGLHPCSVKETYLHELNIVEKYLAERKFVAIGEIGLDLYWDKTFTEFQYTAFHHQINLALKFNLPIVIHSRNAIDECIEVVKQYPLIKGVFHCFSGSAEQAKKILSLGFMLGIGGVLTFKNAGLDKVIQDVGIENVILETDAPYLAPVPFRGKRNEPSYLNYVHKKIAELINRSEDEVAELTTGNAIKLFGLSNKS